jgi:titin
MNRRKYASPTRTSCRPPSGHRPLLEVLEDRSLPSTYVVTNTNDAGLGSLRQAILDVNADSSPDLIDFDIAGSGVHTIAVGDTTGLPLPAITNPVAIDGYSQPGSSVNTLSVGDNAVPQIELDGSALGPGFNGLHITAGNSTVRGLMIDNFGATLGTTPVGGNGILMDFNGGNVIEGNFFGLHSSGGTFSNRISDVTVCTGSGNNVIGGTTPDTRNVISGAAVGLNIGITSGSGNLVQGNYIGTDPSGTSAVPNQDGLDDSGSGNTIGGTVSGARNIFSGNSRSGVGFGDASGEVLEGNYIGVNAQGDAVLTNFSFGILAQGGGGGDLIGGMSPGAGNVIGGVSGLGMELDDVGSASGTNGYKIEGNFFGTDPQTESLNFGNGDGILVEGVRANLGVADTTIAGNVIDNESLNGVEIFGPGAQNNVVQGNFIGTDSGGATAHGNGVGVKIAGGAFDNTVGGISAAARNLISGNGDGVVLSDSGTTGNVVEGNYVGTNAAGNGPLPNNGTAGVEIEGGASGNTIGGTTAGARNVISGNRGEGLVIADSATTGNLVEGNYVGADASGSVRLGNFDGIALSGTGNTIGGTAAGTANVFSGNVRAGVGMGFAVNDVVEGNLIGVNAQATARLTNGSFGILASEGSGDVIAGNVIGGLSGDGIEIDDSGAPDGTNHFVIRGNFLGTDRGGTLNFGNAVGILLEGNALTQGVAQNTVTGNVIDNESLAGVEIVGVAAKDNVVQGNYIGTDTTGTVAHANGVGILVEFGAHANVIGISGTGTGKGNVIAFNTGAGVVIGNSLADSATVDNSVRGNSIYANGGIGIDLGNDGVTPNHRNNPATGPNNLQNFPLLKSARSANGQTRITGTLHGAPNTTYKIDFYASTTDDPLGFRQGQRYLGSLVVTTDANGTVHFQVELAATTPGEVVTATATDPAGNTSEFSAARTVRGRRR